MTITMNTECVTTTCKDESPAPQNESISLHSLIAVVPDDETTFRPSHHSSVIKSKKQVPACVDVSDYSYSEYSNYGEFSNSSSRVEEDDLRPRSSRRRSSASASRVAFLRLVNFSPDSDQGLIAVNEVEIRNLFTEKPLFAKQRYHFLKAFPDHKISPLSLLCSLGATIKTIKVCYEADPSALTEVDAVHGTPLHYACAYHTDKNVVEFLLSEFPKGCDNMVDKNKHNLLHVGAQYGASIEILSQLAHRSPLTLHMIDTEGNTPLHLAIESGNANSVEVVQVLIGQSPASLCTKKNFAGATPLHLALFANAPFEVIQALVEAHEMTLRTTDGKGRLPLHVAAAECEELTTFAYLLRRYREAVNAEDKRGRTPYDVAKKHHRSSDILLLLKAKRMITM